MRKDKKAIVFDLDGTLAKSKLPLDGEMAELLARLTGKKKVAVIGGGKLSLFRRQVLAPMRGRKPELANLFLFPTSGASLFRFRRGWKAVYKLKLSGSEIMKVKRAVNTGLLKAGFVLPQRHFGPFLDNRGTQITFSALGQRAPLSAKKKWNRSSDIRPKIIKELNKLLPEFEIRQGGLTSIDITKKGIDKGYAIKRLMKFLRLRKKEVLFVGDAIFPGGNDYPAKAVGVDCIKTSGPEKTKKVIKNSL